MLWHIWDIVKGVYISSSDFFSSYSKSSKPVGIYLTEQINHSSGVETAEISIAETWVLWGLRMAGKGGWVIDIYRIELGILC